jgi:hypothetical protein
MEQGDLMQMLEILDEVMELLLNDIETGNELKDKSKYRELYRQYINIKKQTSNDKD